MCFTNCAELPTSELKLPEGLEYIGVSAFDTCTSLTDEILIPSTVERIDNRAFYLCGNIKLMNMTNCNTEIGDEAFYATGGNIKSTCRMTKVFTSALKPLRVHQTLLSVLRIFTVVMVTD